MQEDLDRELLPIKQTKASMARRKKISEMRVGRENKTISTRTTIA